MCIQNVVERPPRGFGRDRPPSSFVNLVTPGRRKPSARSAQTRRPPRSWHDHCDSVMDPGVGRTLTSLEDIRTLASQSPTNALAAIADAANDKFGRSDVHDERNVRGVRVLASQRGFVLRLLRAREPLRIDRRRANRAADRAHGLAHGVEEGGVGVLHQTPAIGDLRRGRRRPCGGLAVAAAAIAGSAATPARSPSAQGADGSGCAENSDIGSHDADCPRETTSGIQPISSKGSRRQRLKLTHRRALN